MGHSGAFAATRARPSEGPKKMYSVTSQEDEEEESGTGPGWADEGEKGLWYEVAVEDRRESDADPYATPFV